MRRARVTISRLVAAAVEAVEHRAVLSAYGCGAVPRHLLAVPRSLLQRCNVADGRRMVTVQRCRSALPQGFYAGKCLVRGAPGWGGESPPGSATPWHWRPSLLG